MNRAPMCKKIWDAKINYAYIIQYYMLNLSSYLIYSIINSYSACTSYVIYRDNYRPIFQTILPSNCKNFGDHLWHSIYY